MVTVRDLIQRSYRKIGVVAHDDVMTDDQAAGGLVAWNDMMFGLPLLGINIEHTEQALNDDISVQSLFIEGLVYLLARRIAPDMQVAWPDEDQWTRAIQAATFMPRRIRVDRALMTTPSQRPDEREIGQ